MPPSTLSITGPQPPIVANSNAPTTWKLRSAGVEVTDKTVQWRLFKGTATVPSLGSQGASAAFVITSAGDYTVKAWYKGEVAATSFTATVKDPVAVKIWHNGDTLTLSREGPVLFAVKPDPAIRTIQWNVGGKTFQGPIAYYTMKTGEKEVTAKVTLFPANKGPSNSFSTTVTRPTTSTERKRYNIYEMPVSARQSWQKALNGLKEWGIYDYMIEAHLIVAGMRRMNSMTTDAHNSPAFPVWHRMFIDLYERSLMTEGLEKGYGAPYWNFANEQGIANQCLWTPEMMGNREGQVRDGFMKDWKGYGDEHVPSDPSSMPISRGPPSTLYPVPGMVKAWQDVLAKGTSLDTYPKFEIMRKHIEGIHNNGHVNVGGDMNTMASPNDPIFWMVHMYAEKLFTEWQKSPLCKEAKSYYGYNRKGQIASPKDLLSPWDVTVESWFEPSTGATFIDDCKTELCVRCGTRPIGGRAVSSTR